MHKIQLPATFENFDAFMEFVQKVTQKSGFDESTQKKILLACEEIILNIIKYAYPEKDGEIALVVRKTSEKDGFAIEISDWGIPFDPLKAKEPDIHAPLQERAIGGLGIFLTRKIMDKVEYKRKNDKNEVILIKYRKSNDMD